MIIYKSIQELPFWGNGKYFVDKVRFYYVNAWNDPYLIYGRYVINYYEVENYFWECFNEITHGNGRENLFWLWLSNNAEGVQNFIKENAPLRISKVAA